MNIFFAFAAICASVQSVMIITSECKHGDAVEGCALALMFAPLAFITLPLAIIIHACATLLRALEGNDK